MKPLIFNESATNWLMGIVRSAAIPIPNTPELKPNSPASALKMREISFLRLPRARKIPISFVLSTTET